MAIESDALRLIGHELSSVLVTTNTVQLQFVRYPLSETGKFADSAVIELEHGYEVESIANRVRAIQRDGLEQFRTKACILLGMIDKRVEQCECLDDGGLDIVFIGNIKLSVLASDEGFDGFHIYWGVEH